MLTKVQLPSFKMWHFTFAERLLLRGGVFTGGWTFCHEYEMPRA